MSARSVTRVGASAPEIDAWVPTAVVHVSWLVLAVLLCATTIEQPFWRGMGLLVAMTATLAPHVVPRWWMVLLLGAHQLWRAPLASEWTFYLLLAGVHPLFVLGALAKMMPWSGRVEVAVFVGPAKRFVLVQVGCQLLAVGALSGFGDARGTVTGLSMLAGAMVAVVAFVLARAANASAQG